MRKVRVVVESCRRAVIEPSQCLTDYDYEHTPSTPDPVCAKDAAGNWDCAEDSVGVPLTPAELKHVVPENQGKLFKIAEDRGLWGAAPDELSYRPNPVTAGLNVPVTPEYVLCNSNYKLIGGTSTATTQTTVDQCAIECAATTNCQVRVRPVRRIDIDEDSILLGPHLITSPPPNQMLRRALSLNSRPIPTTASSTPRSAPATPTSTRAPTSMSCRASSAPCLSKKQGWSTV